MSAEQAAAAFRAVRQAQRLRTLERTTGARGAGIGGASLAAAPLPQDPLTPITPPNPAGTVAEVVAVRADQAFDPGGTFVQFVTVVAPPQRYGFAALELPSPEIPLTYPAVYTASVEVDWHGEPGGVVEVWVGTSRAEVIQSGTTLRRDVLVTSSAIDTPVRVALRHGGAVARRASVKLTLTLGNRYVEQDTSRDFEAPAATKPATPTAPGVIAGATLDNAYLDVSWAQVVGADGYEVVATRVSDGVSVTAEVQGGATVDTRLDWLVAGTGYSVVVYALADGALSDPSPATTITTVADETVPGQVIGVKVAPSVDVAVLSFDESPEIDVRGGQGRYEYRLGGVGAWTDLGPATVATLGPFPQGHEGSVEVRAVDRSGNIGPASVPVTFKAGEITAAKMVAGTITAASGILADAVITTAKIADAQITSAKVVSLAANKLTTDTLTSTTITLGTGGVFRAGRSTSPFHYFLQDAAGLRFYRDGTAAYTGGTLALDANVNTGNVTLVGGTIAGGSFLNSTSNGDVEITNGRLFLRGGGTDPLTVTFASTQMVFQRPSGEVGSLFATDVQQDRALHILGPTVASGSRPRLELNRHDRSARVSGDVAVLNGADAAVVSSGGSGILLTTTGAIDLEGAPRVIGAGGASFLSFFRNGSSFARTGYIGHGAADDRMIVRSDGAGVLLSAAAGDVEFTHSGELLLTSAAAKTTSNSANVWMSSTGRVNRSTSSRRYKRDIRAAELDGSAFAALQVKTWRDRNEVREVGDDAGWHVGLVAEEVHDAGLGEFVTYDDKGRPDALKYDPLGVAVGLQALSEIDRLRTEIAELRDLIAA